VYWGVFIAAHCIDVPYTVSLSVLIAFQQCNVSISRSPQRTKMHCNHRPIVWQQFTYSSSAIWRAKKRKYNQPARSAWPSIPPG